VKCIVETGTSYRNKPELFESSKLLTTASKMIFDIQYVD